MLSHPNSLDIYGQNSPFLIDDHTRVKLVRNGLDYVNANHVQNFKANRSYILTQVYISSVHSVCLSARPFVLTELRLNGSTEFNEIICIRFALQMVRKLAKLRMLLLPPAE